MSERRGRESEQTSKTSKSVCSCKTNQKQHTHSRTHTTKPNTHCELNEFSRGKELSKPEKIRFSLTTQERRKGRKRTHKHTNTQTLAHVTWSIELFSLMQSACLTLMGAACVRVDESRCMHVRKKESLESHFIKTNGTTTGQSRASHVEHPLCCT